MKKIELKIPNLGEAEDTEIIEISAKVGDKLSMNDPIIVLESEKAAMEVPSDYDGIIKEIKVKEGDSVKEGAVFAIIEVDEAQETSIEKDDIPIQANENINPKTENLSSERLIKIDFSGINAGPAVRKIARELEIDLTKIIGTGKNEMITKDDLKNFIHSLGSTKNVQYPDLEILKEFGDYVIENQTKIRRAGSKNLTNSWQSIPHVTHFEEIDITKIEEQRSELNKTSSIKISPLAYIVKATCAALEEFPIMNSSLIDEGKLMLKKYINIGIAVNTEQGLLVPNIKDVSGMSVEEIAKNIGSLADKARNKKLLEKDITGATFSISSLGGMGGTGFTPIINPPEVGIIGISRVKNSLARHDGKIIDQKVLPFSLSYDHRVINGADAGNFCNFIKASLEKGL